MKKRGTDKYDAATTAECVRLYAEMNSSAAIAAQLGISVKETLARLRSANVTIGRPGKCKDGRRPGLTGAARERAVLECKELALGGATYREMAQAMNCCRDTVRRLLEESGVLPPKAVLHPKGREGGSLARNDES